MARNQETLNKEMYHFLSSNGYEPKAFDVEGKLLATPDEAVLIRFTFKDDEEDLGAARITIDRETGVTIYFDNDVEHTGSHAWRAFLKQMKDWSMRKQQDFDLQNTERLKHDMAQRQYTEQKEKLGEGYHAMGKNMSYNDNVPNVKIILQHNRKLEEGEQRYRSVAKIFLENTDGERFLVPTTRPGIAQVYARHIAEGGVPNDERWNHVKALCEEYSKMAGFARAVRKGQFNESAQQLVNEGLNHYQSLRETLGKLRGHRGYNMYFESWTPALMEDETDVDTVNQMFVQETMDPRIESVMPILAKLNRNAPQEVKEVAELADWADSITEMDDGIPDNLSPSERKEQKDRDKKEYDKNLKKTPDHIKKKLRLPSKIDEQGVALDENIKSYASAINSIIKQVTGLTVGKTRTGNVNYGDYRTYTYRVYDNRPNRSGAWTPDISKQQAQAIIAQIQNLEPGLKVTVSEGDVIVTQKMTSRASDSDKKLKNQEGVAESKINTTRPMSESRDLKLIRKGEKDFKSYKLYWDSAWDEFVVRYYENGKRSPSGHVTKNLDRAEELANEFLTSVKDDLGEGSDSLENTYKKLTPRLLKQVTDEMKKPGTTAGDVVTKYNIPIKVVSYILTTAIGSSDWIRDITPKLQKQASDELKKPGTTVGDVATKYNIPVRTVVRIFFKNTDSITEMDDGVPDNLSPAERKEQKERAAHRDKLVRKNGKWQYQDGVHIKWDGTQEWYLNGKLHRKDGPAVIWAKGAQEWFLNGKRHRKDGPAVIGANGYQSWYLNGKLHREDGPAFIGADGDQSWWLNDKRHRTDGPAIIRKVHPRSEVWYLNGQLHREDGPAVIWKSGTREWWLNDKRYRTEQEWQNAMSRENKNESNKQGVAEGGCEVEEGLADFISKIKSKPIHPDATIIKTKKGKSIGEIYPTNDGDGSWGAFLYKANRGYRGQESREDAILALKDLYYIETGRSRSEVSEGLETNSKPEDAIGKFGSFMKGGVRQSVQIDNVTKNDKGEWIGIGRVMNDPHGPRVRLKLDQTTYAPAKVDETLDADQKRVGQLGAMDKVGAEGARGQLVGEAVAHDSPEESVIMDIVNGNIDAYDVMNNPKSEAEQKVSGILQDMYERISIDRRLHPDDDFEEIIEIMMDELSSEYDPYPMSESMDEGYRPGEINNGDQVTFKKDSIYYEPGTWTVSRCTDDGKCWIGDEDDRGWYIRTSELELADSMGFGDDDDDFDPDFVYGKSEPEDDVDINDFGDFGDDPRDTDPLDEIKRLLK